jgi:hypothetical protein
VKYFLYLFACAGFLATGCGQSDKAAAEQESRILDRLGNVSVSSTTMTSGVADLKRTEKVMEEIRARSRTVAERVKACREVAGGVPAEMDLGSGVRVTDVQGEFGPFLSESRRRYSPRNKEIAFYRYGNLEIGVDGDQVVVVGVIK